MKLYNKCLFFAVALFGLASCANQEIEEYKVAKPQNIAQYEYLANYDVLKSYVPSTASPDFKLGAAVTSSEFNKQQQLYVLAKSNFDEMTAGNAMKYASVVGNNGAMNFDAVKEFVNTADAAGMTVYGHTLAWHSQQNNKYLNGLIADKEMDTGGTQVVEDAVFDYTTMTGWSYWGQVNESITHETFIGIKDGVFQCYNAAPVDQNYFIQYHVADGIAWKPDVTYTVTMMIRASEKCSITVAAGTWGGNAGGDVEIGTEWKEVSVVRNPGAEGNGFVMFQSGAFAGTIEMQWLKVTHEEAAAAEVEFEKYVETYTDGDFPFYVMGCAPPVIDGAIHFVPTGDWSQFFVSTGKALEPGNYVAYLDITASEAVASGVQLTAQNGWDATNQNVTVGVPLKAGHQVVRVVFNGLEGGNYDFILKPQTAPATLDLKSVTICQVIKTNTMPQTPEEKKAILTEAMDNWIKGMMQATAEKVSAWDAVNEAISGGDFDGDGKYDLQSATNSDDPANNFYWQDYLGNEDYVRIVVAAARKYYAEFGGVEPLKLFINDYNLESDWDNNGKLKSLIEWIEVWESDGVTKIDGIGTQMHVSCYANPTTQASKENAYVNMLNLLAESGKLVKISELDMGYVDANGNTVPTSLMSEEAHYAMAEYYKFIVKKYFEIIPAAQQYGITIWCVTDAPGELNTGWRGGEPVGLWDVNYNRKHVYAGFADGLQGK